jgi:hypothetical protein
VQTGGGVRRSTRVVDIMIMIIELNLMLMPFSLPYRDGIVKKGYWRRAKSKSTKGAPEMMGMGRRHLAFLIGAW